MSETLVYDLTLEVKGIVRSIVLRTLLDRDLSVGETFECRGRTWRVDSVGRVDSEGLDRRLVASQVDDAL